MPQRQKQSAEPAWRPVAAGGVGAELWQVGLSDPPVPPIKPPDEPDPDDPPPLRDPPTPIPIPRDPPPPPLRA